MMTLLIVDETETASALTELHTTKITALDSMQMIG